MHPRAAELITRLQLEPHPEGGYYREIFRSSNLVSPADGRGPRAALTTIYFLLPAGIVSRWHRVAADEVWHLYEGGPLEVLSIDPACSTLSSHQLEAHAPVCTVAAAHWQAARTSGDYALVGCTVGPGFDFADFTILADDATAASRLLEKWPNLA
ncbi:MAG: cupin domain-containing protein, partial [Pseudomonadota bacterium]